ncbi:hypothetical protein TWF730_007383 [Orbilia blumenaviensis]|uniref:Uncharacterized protein n=1 Tax=Orbilia blumenaviensis TaxID=1796055 RepID=A0AAV9V875_9PEZI
MSVRPRTDPRGRTSEETCMPRIQTPLNTRIRDAYSNRQKQKTWDKPDASDGVTTPTSVRMYYQTPQALKNAKTRKDDVKDLLGLDIVSYNEFKALMSFLLTNHNGLMGISRVTTESAKNQICEVCNGFLELLSPQSTRVFLRSSFDGFSAALTDHIRGWLTFQLALFVRRDVIQLLKKEPGWKGKIPAAIEEALAHGALPDIDSFDEDFLSGCFARDWSRSDIGTLDTTLKSINDSIWGSDTEESFLSEEKTEKFEAESFLPSSQETATPKMDEDIEDVSVVQFYGDETGSSAVQGHRITEKPMRPSKVFLIVFLSVVVFVVRFWIGGDDAGREAQ